MGSKLFAAIVLFAALLLLIPGATSSVASAAEEDIPVEEPEPVDTDIIGWIIAEGLDIYAFLEDVMTEENFMKIANYMMTVDENEGGKEYVEEDRFFKDGESLFIGNGIMYQFVGGGRFIFQEGSTLSLGKNFSLRGQGIVIDMQKGSILKLGEGLEFTLTSDHQFSTIGTFRSQYSLERSESLSVTIHQSFDIIGNISIDETVKIQGVVGHVIDNTIEASIISLGGDPLKSITFSLSGEVNISKITYLKKTSDTDYKDELRTVKGPYRIDYDPSKDMALTAEFDITTKGSTIIDVTYSDGIKDRYIFEFGLTDELSLSANRIDIGGTGSFVFDLSAYIHGTITDTMDNKADGVELRMDMKKENIDGGSVLSTDVSFKVGSLIFSRWIELSNINISANNIVFNTSFTTPVSALEKIENLDDLMYHSRWKADMSIETVTGLVTLIEPLREPTIRIQMSLFEVSVPEKEPHSSTEKIALIDGMTASIRGGSLQLENYYGVNKMTINLRRSTAKINAINEQIELDIHSLTMKEVLKGEINPYVRMYNASVTYPLYDIGSYSLVMNSGQYEFENIDFDRLIFGPEADIRLENVTVWELYVPEKHGKIDGYIMVRIPATDETVAYIKVGDEIDMIVQGAEFVNPDNPNIGWPAVLNIYFDDESHCNFFTKIGTELLPAEEGYIPYSNEGVPSETKGTLKVFLKQSTVRYNYEGEEAIESKAYCNVGELKVLDDTPEKKFVGWFDGNREVLVGENYVVQPFDVTLTPIWSSSPAPEYSGSTVTFNAKTEEVRISAEIMQSIISDMEIGKIKTMVINTSNAVYTFDSDALSNDLSEGLRIRLLIAEMVTDDYLIRLLDDGHLILIYSNFYILEKGSVDISFLLPVSGQGDYSPDDLKSYALVDAGLVDEPIVAYVIRDKIDVTISTHFLSDHIIKDYDDDDEFNGNSIEAAAVVGIVVALFLVAVTGIAIFLRGGK